MNLLFKSFLCISFVLTVPFAVVAQSKSKAATRHTIAKGENLYVVARKYGVSLADLQKANPSLKGTLAVGQEVVVPAGGTAKVQPAVINLPVSNSVVKMGKPAVPPPAKSKSTAEAVPSKTGTYQVQPGETMLGIANRNGITVEDLQKANKLTGTSLKVGQKLLIPGKKTLTAAKPILAPKQPIAAAPAVVVSKAVPVVAKPATNAGSAAILNTRLSGPGTDEQSYFSGARAVSNGKRAVRESGLATMIDGRMRTGKMLALHRTAPIGSTLQVRNSMTGQLVNVRVIGKLPDIGMNEKVVVKLSRKAYEKLGAGDRRSLVEVNSI
jgi:LysM repeat protein